MYPGRYFMPNMTINPLMIRNGYVANRGIGLFGRMVQGLRSFNWTRLLNGTSKTLNVMNQTIPLIRQAKPMVGNVKNMLHLAKVFRNETSNNNYDNKKYYNKKAMENVKNNVVNDINNSNSNFPIFFV